LVKNISKNILDFFEEEKGEENYRLVFIWFFASGL